MGSSGRSAYPRRFVDHVTDELVLVLRAGGDFEFKELFLKVFAGLKRKNAVSGGEEMLRLRCYEKLQDLAKRNLVKKTGRTYCGLDGLEQATSPYVIAHIQAAMAARAASAHADSSAKRS